MLARTVVTVALALVCAASAPASVTLSIVGTNDVHGGILERDGRGGLALFAGYVDNLRAARKRDGGAVMLIDAGDMFQGTLESNLNEGAVVVSAYNALGYAAAAIGNHEFDFGPVGPRSTPASAEDDPRGALKARAAEAHFPFLAANLIDASTGRMVDWPNVKPSVTVDALGVKVGIVGLLTEETLSTTIASNTRGLRIAPLEATLEAEAKRLRAGGASVVVLTTHAGGRCRTFDSPSDLSSCDQAAEIFTLARSLPAGLVDAIVAGHTHAGIAQDVNGVPIIESFSTGLTFGRIDLTVDQVAGRVAAHHTFRPQNMCAREDPRTHRCDTAAPPAVYEGAPVLPDAAIARVLEPAVAAARSVKARPLGVVLDTPIRRSGQIESPLGNLFADAYRQSTPRADIAINNTDGGLRADLPAGPLTYGSVFEVFPFDNKLVPLRLTGAELRRVIRAQIDRGARPLGLSGARVEARCEGPSLVLTLLRPNGSAIRDDDPLVVVTTDFLAMAGDGVFTPVMPAKGFPLPDDAPLARDVVTAWIERRGGHLRDRDLVDLKNPRWPASVVRCGGASSETPVRR
jgi:2',3'-cyclic-nucleotide 2'-phosphodiesterase (5'-nucleotidase family)